MAPMNESTQAERIVKAVRTLDSLDQNMFLWALMGLVKLDSPQTIVDAAEWTSVADEIQKALDKLD